MQCYAALHWVVQYCAMLNSALLSCASLASLFLAWLNMLDLLETIAFFIINKILGINQVITED